MNASRINFGRGEARRSHRPNSARRPAARLTKDDRRFISDFEALGIPPDKFRHRDHVRLAFLYLCQLPPLDAVSRFSTSLQRFATHHGKSGLYHETITWAFVFLIRERMTRAGKQCSWRTFARANPDLILEGKSLLKKYYRDETLTSDLARTTFLLPDRI